MTEHTITSTDPSRRQVLCGLAVALLVPGALVSACGDDSGGTTAGTTTGAGSTSASGDGGGGAPTGTLAALSDVPVGGGLLVSSGPTQVLLVRLSETEVKGYDPRCTHQRVVVDPPRNGVISCSGHGSQFQAADASVLKGPATSPLKAIPVKIDGTSVVLA